MSSTKAEADEAAAVASAADAVTRAVVDAAMQVPGELLALGAGAIEEFPGWSSRSEAALVGANPATHYREHAGKISRSWSCAPEMSGDVVAAAMRSAVSTAASVRAEHQVSLVWTGPATEALGLRTTRSVLDTLVANAIESLVLVSFASYDVANLTTALASAIARGVEVTIILETPDDPGAPLDIDKAHPFAPIKDTASFYHWPLEAREAFFATTARLHAKCVVADQSSTLITSANLTSAGINDNIELGVLIEAGPLPAKLHSHLGLLIEENTLEAVETS